jgi:hypothetical protein
LDPRANHWIESRFQHLVTHVSNPWGDAPGSPRRIRPVAGYDEIAPMALERYSAPPTT